MPFVTDEEIVFNAKDLDLLNGKAYSAALAKAIENAPEKGTFIIGLFGEWGIGKSSIIKTVQDRLKKAHKEKIKVITYDAWKYVDDNFRRTFILDINEQLGVPKKQQEKLRQKLYTDTIWETAKKVLSIRNIAIFAGSVATALAILHWVFGMKWDLAGAFALFGNLSLSFMIFCINTILLLFSETKQSIHTPLLFSPEQFEQEFKKALEYSNKQKYDKLVIVIDNIDRCSAESAYNLLTNIKTFMVEQDNLIFVIPTDNKSLCEHFSNRFNGDSKKAYEFLRKIFNLEIRIKPLEGTELFKFTNDINKKHKLGFSSDAVSIIANEYASNPRRIKQFFNNAISEIDVLSERLKDLSKQELELAKNTVCKLLIIRDEWPWYYDLVLQAPNMLLKSEYISNSNRLYGIEGLQSFLKCTAPFKCVEEEHLLRKIVSNNSHFDALKKSIKDLNDKEITDFVSKDSDSLTLFVKYACSQLKEKITQKVWLEAINLFRAILRTNNIKDLSENHNSMIQSEIKGSIRKIIEGLPTEETDKLIKYINLLNQQSKTYLFVEIMNEYIKPMFVSEGDDAKEKRNIDKKVDSLFKAMVFGVNDTFLFKKYQDVFAEWYKTSEIALYDNKIKNPECFINESFVKHLMQSLSFKADEDFYYKELLFVLPLFKLNDYLISALFDKINSLYSGYAWGKKSETLDTIDKVSPMIKLIKPTNIPASLNKFVANVFKSQIVYINYSNENKFLKDELSSDAEYKQVIDFISTLFGLVFERGTKDNDTGLGNKLKQFYNQYSAARPDLKPIFLNSLKENLTSTNCIITRVSSLVFGSNVFNDAHLYFVKSMSDWTYTNNGQYVIGDDELAAEIKIIISQLDVVAEPRKQAIRKFIDEMLEKRETATTKAILSDVKNLGKEIIIHLPDSAKKLVLSNIYENLENYEDNQDILEMVAENADKPVISELMTIVIKKVVIDATRQTAIDIYKKIPPKQVAVRDRNKMKPWIEESKSEVVK